MPIGLAAASGGFKLGRSLFQAGKRYVKSRVAAGKAQGFNLTSGGFSANLAGNAPGLRTRAADPTPGAAPGGYGTGTPDGEAMDWKKYAPILGVVALLLIMNKK